MKNTKPFAVALLSAVVLLGGLAACTPLPSTTYTNASGQEVTVNWRDFPGPAGVDPNGILAAPVKEDAEAVSAELLLDIKTALSQEFGVVWESWGDASWHTPSGNGFGGKTKSTTYNSVRWFSNTAPAATADWDRIVEIIDGFTQAQGLGKVMLEHNRGYYRQIPSSDKDLLERFGTTDPREAYVWFGTAYGASQWLSVEIHHAGRDPRGKAAAEYRELKQPAASISLDYGVTTLARDDVAAFKKALEPFTGLEQPAATTSD